MFSGFWGLMMQGGWDMWLLLLISVVGVAVAIERLVFFASQHGDTKGLLRQIGQRIAADDHAEVPALTGWRRELFGEKAIALKHGKLALAIEKGKVAAVKQSVDAVMNDLEHLEHIVVVKVKGTECEMQPGSLRDRRTCSRLAATSSLMVSGRPVMLPVMMITRHGPRA